MPQRLIIVGKSNWETIAFLLINDILSGHERVFRRSEVMSPDLLDVAIKRAISLGHKRNPKHPEETLQKTLQNLRDKGFVDFLGRGDYKLTADGYNKMSKVVTEYKDVVKEFRKLVTQ